MHFFPTPANKITWFLLILVMVMIGWLSSCNRDSQNIKKFKASLQEKGEIVVLTRYGPTTYYQRPQGKAGLEYEMVHAFATSLGIKPRLTVVDSTQEIFQALEAGKGDFAAAGLTITPERQKRFRFSPSYQEVQQEVVCHQKVPLPKTLKELSQLKILVISSSSYEEQLRELQKHQPDLRWSGNAHLSIEEILKKIENRRFDCTIADSNIVDINQRFFPDLRVAMTLGQEQELAWLLPSESEELAILIDRWFANTKDTPFFDDLIHRYYGHVREFDYVDSKRFFRHSKRRLPRYETVFQQAAEQHDLPWTLLAAQAYQESHWNPKAKSPTGVRGIMMLTRNTAAELGIQNRLNPAKSIRGGARYLDMLKNRLPEGVQEPDRTWLALAAYNIGFGHLRDAMKLARKLDKDPYRWKDLKTILPLLSRKTYYRHLPHGYARGTEPVRYVERIRHYQDMLERQITEI